MVKKLIKHEYYYYLRRLVIYLPIMLALSLFTRIIQIFENPHIAYTLVYSSTMFMLYIASFVSIILTMILAIVRFYKNMFSQEGYLTFTLPINKHHHLLVKLLVSSTCIIATLFVVIISWLIAISGYSEMFLELNKDFDIIFEGINPIHTFLYILEIIILSLVSLVFSIMLYYTCITIGQLAKKNRILLSIGVYFGYNALCQILGTILMIVISIIAIAGGFKWFGSFVDNHPYLFFNLIFIVAIIVYGGIGTGFYFISYNIIDKKLNLE